jgi:hypothetical protein
MGLAISKPFSMVQLLFSRRLMYSVRQAVGEYANRRRTVGIGIAHKSILPRNADT